MQPENPATDAIDADIVNTARQLADGHQRDGQMRTAMILRQSAWEIERLRRRAERAEAWTEQLKIEVNQVASTRVSTILGH